MVGEGEQIQDDCNSYQIDRDQLKCTHELYPAAFDLDRVRIRMTGSAIGRRTYGKRLHQPASDMGEKSQDNECQSSGYRIVDHRLSFVI